MPSKPQRSQAEIDYGTGARSMPPMLHEMSPTSQGVAAAGFSGALSNLQSREQRFADSGAKGALEPGQIARLRDTEVSIDTAAGNLAGHWNRMMGAPDRPDPAWYFGHNRRLTAVAETHGMDPSTVIDASGAMSPQNDPDSEYRAVSAMSDAIAKGRMVTDRSMGRRKLTTLTPDEMQGVTSTANVGNVSHAADFDLPGFRNAGTNRQAGWRTLLDPDYNAVDEMKAAKVHLYTNVIKASEADTPLHHEYEMRFGDQAAARDVRLGRAADKKAGVTGSEAIRGVPDRVDLYGLMKGSTDPSDPAYEHKILGARGMAVPDTWMSGLLSGQEMHDEAGSSSPAKAAGSQTASTTAAIKGSTFMSPKEAEAAGGKPVTGGAMWGMAALAAIQGAALKAREPESQTNIPPVMMQEMTWTHARGEVAKSTQELRDQGVVPGGTAASRVARLTSGTLEGQKEFRGSDAPASVSRIETPGLFSRGYDNPLDTDSVSIVPRQHPSSGMPLSTTQGAPSLSRFHEQAAAGAPDEFSKRRAILNAQSTYGVSRSDGGAAWTDGGTKKSKRPG